jgi:hypothetical protein
MNKIECPSPACVRYSTCFFPDKCPKIEGNKMNLSELPVSNTPEYERVGVIDQYYESGVDWEKYPNSIPKGTVLYIRKSRQTPALFKPKET